MRGIEQFLQVDAATLGALKYAGTWNASTNTPTLASGVGVQGQYYVVSVAGSTNLDGETAWQVGDWAVFNGSVWQKVDGGSTGLLTTLTVTGNTFLATTSGDVGIGTSSPSAKLDVVGSLGIRVNEDAVGTKVIQIRSNYAGLGPSIQVSTADPLLFLTSNAERMRITAGGDVGIGTSSPGSRLTVAGNVEIRGGAGTFFGDATNATFPSIKSPALNTIGFFLNSGAETARINASGNVGIGTSSPSERLHVSGGGSDGAIRVVGGASGNGYLIARTTGEFDVLNVANAALRFYTNSSVRATIDAAGNLGLGVTPNAWASGWRALQSLGGNSFYTDSSVSGIISNAIYDGAWKYVNTAAAGIFQVDRNSHKWFSAPSGTSGTAVTFTNTMTLNSAGNLGLGVTPSAWATYKATQVGWSAFAGYAAADTAVFSNAFFDGGYKYIGNGFASQYRQINSAHQWFTAPSGTAGDAISFTQAMTLDASGNLGIGTTSPAYKLDVVGSTSTARFGKLIVVDDTPFYTGANINSGANSLGVGSTGATHVGFFTNNAERARITSSGDFHVARTTTADTTVGISLFNSGTITCARSSSSDADLNLYVYSTGAAAARFYVGMGGTVYATNTTISAISDQRFKENIRDLDVGLNAIMALKPRKFDWKTGKGKDIKDDRGFIAQEFEQVFPDLVDDWADPAPKGEDPYKSVRQDLIPVLVKAIQELKAEVDSLKTQLGA